MKNPQKNHKNAAWTVLSDAWTDFSVVHEIFMKSRGRSVRGEHPRGISLVFVIILMTIIMLVASTMSASFIRASQRNHDLYRSTQAYYASRASMEKALAVVSSNGVGYEDIADPDTSPAIEWDTVGDGVTDAYGGYEIFAQAKPIDWQVDGSTSSCMSDYCYVPIPGTGDVGPLTEDEGCDFEDTTQDWAETSGVSEGSGTGWDNDCNWNKIKYGETISIPFFYTDSSGGIQNPSNTGLIWFALRLRTPIDATTGSRYSLDDFEDGDGLDDDDVLVEWQFVGTCDSDGDGSAEENCYLGPIVDPIAFWGAPESMIEESDVNLATQYEVLDSADYGINQDGNEQLILGGGSFLSDSTLSEPYLKLQVISPLTNGSTEIPYLEYQIEVDAEISDNKTVYTAVGKAIGRMGTYIRNLQASQSIESNSVVNFVIQN